jgi:hypothetical protein
LVQQPLLVLQLVQELVQPLLEQQESLPLFLVLLSPL